MERPKTKLGDGVIAVPELIVTEPAFQSRSASRFDLRCSNEVGISRGAEDSVVKIDLDEMVSERFLRYLPNTPQQVTFQWGSSGLWPGQPQGT